MTVTLRPGPIDVHAHWLPQELFDLPPGAPYRPISDRDGQLFIGDIPLSIDSRLMSDVSAIRADMDRTGVAVRVLSAPPFAFARNDLPGAAEYADAFNESLSRVVLDGDGALVGLGCVSLGNVDDSARQIRQLQYAEGIVGIAIPPLAGDDSLDAGTLREVVRLAARANLSVLVHPMQLPGQALGRHYLTNLIGNPVETAVAVASTLLGGVLDELPDLRICFVHGGGCAPSLLGRWDHAWHARSDVSADSQRPPSEGFPRLFFDTVTHDEDALSLLTAKAGVGQVLLGSDYPFDMADSEPLTHALERGMSAHELERAARRFLGV
ncbi:amidohydrolase family protein [Microbacterium sp. LWH13-1.2]|uniref:amidohydrolase family protein n=1 Tax=Microbacterium sp. LWH13-1.2 TaxID=3135260 RepID=UPI003138880E